LQTVEIETTPADVRATYLLGSTLLDYLPSPAAIPDTVPGLEESSGFPRRLRRTGRVTLGRLGAASPLRRRPPRVGPNPLAGESGPARV
jgi:hypothetical protein